MNSKMLGAKAFLLSVALVFAGAAFAANQPDTVKQSADGKQTIYAGVGLQSLLNELSARGIDPNKLRVVDENGNIITPFTPGVTVSWQHVVNNAGGITTGGDKLHANDLASGTGTPNEIENDVITVTHAGTVTVTTFTWQYQFNSATGQWGWVALGVSNVSYQVNTQQK